MKLEDALFNWLQMKIVSEARPDDKAAEETRLFFEEILREDHAVSELETQDDEERIHIVCKVNGAPNKLFFDKDYAEQLLHDINSNPKYNQ
ncbi:hypothetical protein GCM10023310_41550 [Paenibacillus vulneris]|uniref:Uncharacterized protein n=1 Tax=Paenibacillus vulneris TaxID=1133364 RepID=A0ABW3URG5_9BACL|nr:hypothetical protein [Paenibacillus sp. 32352]